jgi:hypothetical protein
VGCMKRHMFLLVAFVGLSVSWQTNGSFTGFCAHSGSLETQSSHRAWLAVIVGTFVGIQVREFGELFAVPGSLLHSPHVTRFSSSLIGRICSTV